MKHFYLFFIFQFLFSTIAYPQANQLLASQNLTENEALKFAKALPADAFVNTAFGITQIMKDSLFAFGKADSAENHFSIEIYNNDFVEIECKVSTSTKEKDLNSTVIITAYQFKKSENKIWCVYTDFNNYDYVDFWEFNSQNDSAKKVETSILFPEITTELFFEKNIDNKIIAERNKQKEEYNKNFYSAYNANEGDENFKKTLMRQYYNPVFSREVKIFDYYLDLKDKMIYVSFNADDIAGKILNTPDKKTNFVKLKWDGEKFKISK
jgi:hypothetical protein